MGVKRSRPRVFRIFSKSLRILTTPQDKWRGDQEVVENKPQTLFLVTWPHPSDPLKTPQIPPRFGLFGPRRFHLIRVLLGEG